MSLIRAKIENIHDGVLLTDYRTGEVLEESSPVLDGHIITCESDRPFYDTSAYEVAGAFGTQQFDLALTIRLDLPSGFGRRRTDLFNVSDEAVSIGASFRRGVISEKHRLRFRQMQEMKVGVHFRFDGKIYRGVLGTDAVDDNLELGGTSLDESRMLVCSREQFGNESPIGNNDVFELAGTKYRVDELELTPTAVEFSLVEVR